MSVPDKETTWTVVCAHTGDCSTRKTRIDAWKDGMGMEDAGQDLNCGVVPHCGFHTGLDIVV